MITITEMIKKMQTMVSEGVVDKNYVVTVDDVEGFCFEIKNIEIRNDEVVLIPKYED